MSPSARAAALTAPASVYIGLAFLLPVAVLIGGTFAPHGVPSLAAYGRFFTDPLGLVVLWRTIRIGIVVTVLCVILGYAMALAIVDAGSSRRGRLLGLTILPLMFSPVARTYAWVVILGRVGLVNNLLVALGLTDQPFRLLFTEGAVYVGLVQLFLPIMVLPLVSALENLPGDVVAAARTLGAGWLTVFARVVLPLTREGLVIGGTLVFNGAVTAYITPAVLGGTRNLSLATWLYQQVAVANDLLAAGVLATILIAMSVFASLVLRRIGTIGTRVHTVGSRARPAGDRAQVGSA
jgi:putative spermidine/putrescine transport system permease protein